MKLNVYFLSLVLLILSGCDNHSKSIVPKVYFNLSDAKQMDISEFVDSISLILLETNDYSLLKSVQALNVTDSLFMIEDRGVLLSFNRRGDFLFSTSCLQGEGPQNYYSGMDFTLLPNGNIEVFDPVGCELLTYNMDLQYVSTYKLPKDILPVSGYLYLTDDYRLFINKNELRLFSINENKIVDIYKDFDIPHFSIFDRNGFHVNGNSFFVSTKHQNYYYELIVDKKELELRTICEFDFGSEANLNLADFPKGKDERYYLNYFDNNPRKTYVTDKYVDDERNMCFFIYNNKSYFAYQNWKMGLNQVYYNEVSTQEQFMPANFYKNGVFYYVSEPLYLQYLVDKSLMSPEDVNKLKLIREDDNPVIICYKLK